MRNEPLEQKPDHQINLCGATETRMGCVSPPLSLIQNKTGDFGVPFARLRRSALQPPLQCTATAPAVHCIRPCSALHLFPQTFASRVANVIIPGCKRYHPGLQTLSSWVANVILSVDQKNHSFADMGPRVKKYGIRASAFSGCQSDAGTVSRVEDIAQPHWSALLGRR